MITQTAFQIASLLLVHASVYAATPFDTSTLTATQRQAFERITAEEFCGCNTAMTIAGCLELRPQCKLAQHLASIAKRGVQASATTDEVLAFLSHSVMRPFCSASQTLNVASAPAEGPANAAITVVEFADFRCGHCQRAAPIIHKAVERYKKSVRLVFIPYPVQDHPFSINAAEAALAAAAQGKFRAMHDAMMAHKTGEFDRPTIIDLAKKAGLDVERLQKDLESGRYRAQVSELKEIGKKAGVEGTPAFFINGRRFEFDPTLLTFEDRFEMEFDRNQGRCQ